MLRAQPHQPVLEEQMIQELQIDNVQLSPSSAGHHPDRVHLRDGQNPACKQMLHHGAGVAVERFQQRFTELVFTVRNLLLVVTAPPVQESDNTVDASQLKHVMSPSTTQFSISITVSLFSSTL